MRKKLLFLLALLIVSSATFAASPKLAFRNKPVQESIVATIKGKAGQVKAQAIVPEFSTVSKVRAVDPISTFPYVENFDVADITTEGWLISDPSTTVVTSGSFNMKVGALSGLAALSGSTYLISGYDTYASRNAWAFSPAMNLTAGVTYHVYIYAYASGFSGVKDEFKVTVGTDQTAATQTTVLIDKTGANSAIISEWTKFEGTFTPSADGVYNFAISHCTVAKDVNAVAFENFVVSNSEYIEPPIVSIYYPGGLWSATSDNDSIYLSPSQAISHTVGLKNAASFSWGFDGAAIPSSLTDTTVSVVYNTEGAHTATVEASGPGGSDIWDATYYIAHPVNNSTVDLVGNIKNSYDDYTASTFSTNNYVAGPNAYYKIIAEKYTLPSDVTVSISKIDFLLYMCTLSSTNRAKAFTIKIYKADGANGAPGTLVSTLTPKFSDVFGSSNITSTITEKIYTLATPVTVQGSFYISMDFTNVGTPSSSNRFCMLSTVGREYNDCSLYAYSSNAWTPMSSLLTSGGDISSYVFPFITYVPTITTSVSNPTKEDFKVFVNNGILNIENATAGTAVSVYDVAGKLAYSNVITNVNSALPLDLKAGVYVVRVADNVSKVVIK